MSINKKLVSIALTASTVLWATGIAALPLANAQTTSSLQAQIAALLAQIQQLQGQLNNSGSTTSTSCSSFTTDLTVGSSGAQVTALQQILINKGYLTAVSAPTGYFGALTQAAVAKWQAANGITPTAGYFGPKSRAFINSACTSTTTTTTTTTTGTGTGTSVVAPASGLSVSLSSLNPAAGSLITSASGNGAARVPVLAVNFTAGNSGAITVTGVNFHKTGVLADSSVAGAYLTLNGQVVAQYNSISNGVISFSGLNLSIPAGQTETYYLAIDVAGGLSAGNTTGFSLNSASDVTAWDTNNNAVTAMGSFPLMGNTFTVTSVSNPSLASLTITTSSIGTTVTAGTQGNIVGAFNFSVQNNPLWLNSIAFHVIGSANMANLQNVKLLINGTQVGATLSSVGANNIAYFNLTSAPAKLNTGTNNVQIQSDVTGSPSFTFQWEVLNGYDVLAIDSQYNVPVSTTITAGTDAQVTIQAGQTTTSQDTSTPTGNIAKGVSQVTLAKFDVYASGEPTKVKFLDFDLVFSGVTTSSPNMLSVSQLVKNVNITDDSGQQVGTTINTPPSGASCAQNGSASGYSTTGGGNSTITSGSVTYEDCFGSPSSNINYVIPANTTRVLSLKADIQPNASFSTVTANLLSESGQNNLQGQISSQQNSSGAANGSALTLSTSELTATQNSALGSQSLSKGSTNQEVGSYSLTAGSAEGVNVNTVSIAVNSGSLSGYLQNLKVIVNGAQFGTTQPTVSAGTYTFSGSPFNVPAGSTVSVNVYADINSSASGSSSGGLTTLSGLSGSGAVSNTSISLASSVAGQNLLVSSGSSITVSANQGGNPSVGQLSMGTTGNTLAAFNFQETANVEPVKITQLNVVDMLTSSTLGQATNTAAVLPSFNTLSLWNGATQVGGQANYVGTTSVNGANGFLYQFQFGNSSNFVIPRNGTLSLTLKGNANSFTGGNVTDGSIHTFEIATSTSANGVTNINTTSTVVALGQTSNQPANVVLTSAAGTQQTVLRNGLVFSAAQLGGTSNRSKSTGDQLATLTFTPGNGGALAINTSTITFTGNAISSTVSSAQAFGDSMYLLLNGTKYSPASGTCMGPSNCSVTWNFGSGISGFQVNGSPVTFTLVADDFDNTVVAGSNNSVSLAATVSSLSSIQYTDGTDSNSTTATAISLPASVITPLQIFSTQFVQNS